jgi:hypothetical protein
MAFLAPKSPELRAKQLVVLRGGAGGLTAAACMAVALYSWLPPIAGMEQPIDRLVLALRCNVFVAIMLWAGVHVIARKRIRSESIDPLAVKETPAMRVHARYLDNTMQQAAIFLVSSTALSTFLDGETMRIVPIATFVFVVGRGVFWWGYLRDPLRRAPGMAMTLVTNAGMLFYTAYRVVRLALE